MRSEEPSAGGFPAACESRGAASSQPSSQALSFGAVLPRAFAQPRRTKVVLLLTGVINDGGWSQPRLRGHPAAFAPIPALTLPTPKTITLAPGAAGPPEATPTTASTSSSATAFEFLERAARTVCARLSPPELLRHRLQAIAPHFPAISCSSTWAYFEAAYGAGALAALISNKRQAVGFVGGADDPQPAPHENWPFIAGATAHRAQGFTALASSPATMTTPPRAREGRQHPHRQRLRRSLARRRCHRPLALSRESRSPRPRPTSRRLGCYSDQTALAPSHMAASFRDEPCRHGPPPPRMQFANHTFQGGTEWHPNVSEMWLLRAGAHGDHNPALVTASAMVGFRAGLDRTRPGNDRCLPPPSMLL